MTEHGHNFIREIAEAYRAMEAEPAHLDRIKELEAKVDSHAQHAQNVELKLIDRHTEIEELKAKLRSVEAERDDAGFRVLEAEDKSQHAVVALQELRKVANDVIVAMTGTSKTDMVFMSVAERAEWETHKRNEAVAKAQAETIASKAMEVVVFPVESGELNARPTLPEPVPVTPSVSEEPVSTPQQGESAPLPIEALPASTITGTDAAASVTEAPEVAQSHPTVQSTLGSSSSTVPSVGATSPDDVSTEPPVKGPYHGKRYHDLPAQYISIPDWLAGGGTEEDYFWTPTQFASAVRYS